MHVTSCYYSNLKKNFSNQFISVHYKWQESWGGSKASHPGAESSPARGPSQSSQPWPLLQHSRTEAVLEHLIGYHARAITIGWSLCHLLILHLHEDLHKLWGFLFHCDVIFFLWLSCISIYDLLVHDFNHVNLLFWSLLISIIMEIF